jgi:hypothetical protein
MFNIFSKIITNLFFMQENKDITEDRDNFYFVNFRFFLGTVRIRHAVVGGNFTPTKTIQQRHIWIKKEIEEYDNNNVT